MLGTIPFRVMVKSADVSSRFVSQIIGCHCILYGSIDAAEILPTIHLQLLYRVMSIQLKIGTKQDRHLNVMYWMSNRCEQSLVM